MSNKMGNGVRVYTIDPERIADRLFGGPYFTSLTIMGDRLISPCGKKYWKISELNSAWTEGRNLKGLSL